MKMELTYSNLQVLIGAMQTEICQQRSLGNHDIANDISALREGLLAVKRNVQSGGKLKQVFLVDRRGLYE